MPESDAETIHAVLNGDVDRYAELVNAYQQPVLRLAYSFVGNYEDAKDVAQDAFVDAYRSLRRFGSAPGYAWN